MTLLLMAIGLAAGGATLLGGALALRFADRVHLVLGFSAGAVIGVALLDLLPEAMRSGAPAIANSASPRPWPEVSSSIS
jgi:ZIP family zinc transporter